MRKATKLEKKVFKYLNELRTSGITNMYGAGEYVEGAFGIKAHEAKQYLRSVSSLTLINLLFHHSYRFH